MPQILLMPLGPWLVTVSQRILGMSEDGEIDTHSEWWNLASAKEVQSEVSLWGHLTHTPAFEEFQSPPAKLIPVSNLMAEQWHFYSNKLSTELK